ncbi:MAG: Re/Si-specific NAD(P)(+) transhydrogenase subunit alpha [Spirochaetales bacterium]|nr:Re/Si-specific NAD(P)(+) transhydrogenase subunit alpha [Spirochaetales bacterium]
MIIGIPKEPKNETRCAITPEIAKKVIALGAKVQIEAGAGEAAGHPDTAYKTAGAAVLKERKKLFSTSDMIVRINKPDTKDIALLHPGTVHISFLDPFNEKSLVQSLASRGVTALCMELIPRSTKAQKMDALSSQASLGGYAAVILAAERLQKIFPMMVTPSGTISPARVFIIGAGVAGLQAIATAKRLGARVEAFDTRPAVEEQVRSLGAKFVKLDLGATGETKDGYAKQLTPKQIQKQREMIAKYCEQADIVITTAQVFGKKAPVIVTKQTVARMNPGSIIVDMAAGTGGNVEGTVCNREINKNGVVIIGYDNLPGMVPYNATQMYANNIFNLLEEFWDKETKQFDVATQDDILASCVITKDKKICSEMLVAAFTAKKARK